MRVLCIWMSLLAQKRRSRLSARLPDGVWECSAKLLAQAVLMPFSKLSSKDLPKKGFSRPFEVVSNPKCRQFCAQNLMCQAPALPSWRKELLSTKDPIQLCWSYCRRFCAGGPLPLAASWLTGHLGPQTPLLYPPL